MDKLNDLSEEEDDESQETGIKEEEQSAYLNTRSSTVSTPLLNPSSKRSMRGKEEKERTKMRERHRRAITARILGGLRQHGNYNLRARSDINEVIAALAREAGWVVMPDGTTFPSSSSSEKANRSSAAFVGSHSAALPLRGISPAIGGARSRGVFTVGSGSPLCFASGGGMSGTSRDELLGGDGLESGEEEEGKMAMEVLPVPRLPERDFAGTPYVPVFVMLPLGMIDMKCEINNPDGVIDQLKKLKSAGVDGVMVDCWWGIVESDGPDKYNWTGYKQLFHIVRQLKLKLQVVMSFHKCGGNVGDDIEILLPSWIAEIGKSNPDIYFTDKSGNRNPECLSWGVDKERVLKGRTALEVYFDFMRSFRVEFDEFFEDGIISEIEIGLGPCGELRYPSYPMEYGWKYPGIGEFQCYDRYLMQSLRKAAQTRGHLFWAKGPENTGNYNSCPHETGFFSDGGEYDGYYGRFFLNWYSNVLIEHADRVLMLAELAFEGSKIAAKLSGVHWWYKTASHAAELTAGFYNPCNRDGYAPIAHMLKKHNTILNFTCVELYTRNQHEDFPQALSDPEGLVWQVLNAAWDAGVQVASENALPCFDRDGFNKILENAKPLNDPDGRHLVGFTYLRLCPDLLETNNFEEFKRFVKRMHGEAVLDLQR